jgi:hypothetical protein
MPPVALFAPVLFPFAAAALTAACGLAGWKLGRVLIAAGLWAALIALLILWIPVRATQDLNVGPLGFGAELDVRLDAVSFAFGVLVLLPAAILFTLQARTWQEGTVAALAVASSMLAIEAAGALFTALAGGAAATLVVILLDIEDPRAPRPRWSVLLAAWLALSWAGAILVVGNGTAIYSAVPVSSLTVPMFVLLASSALLASGLFPWRGWAASLWTRPSLRAAGIAVAALYPLGFYLLIRAYETGDGRYPSAALNYVLAAIGALVAFGAAARAQAASTRREYLAEIIPGLGGFAFMSISLGSALGVAAGLATLATIAVFAAALPLLPDRGGTTSLVVVAAAAGLPPGIAFGARVVGITATFEAGDLVGVIGIGAMVAWVVSMTAAARAIGLPAGRGHPEVETAPRIAMGIAILTVLAGPGLAVLLTTFAIPAQAAVMPTPPSLVGGGLLSVVTVSSLVRALTLFGPLAVLGVLAYLAAGGVVIRSQARPHLFNLPGSTRLKALIEQLRAATVPEQYRSLVNPQALEAAVAAGSPILWLAALVALSFAVTR